MKNIRFAKLKFKKFIQTVMNNENGSVGAKNYKQQELIDLIVFDSGFPGTSGYDTIYYYIIDKPEYAGYIHIFAEIYNLFLDYNLKYRSGI